MAEETKKDASDVNLDHDDVTTTYANWYQVLGTPEEVLVEFGLTPTLGLVTENPIRVKQRLVMSFYTAKRLAAHLHYAVRRYESAFGSLEIDVPARLEGLAAKREAGKKKAA
jgi:hypothetical protein